MSSHDCLIWIGESYSKVICKSKKSCAIPFKKKDPHCYVHEAEWRGCCRKVPQIPPWIIPGKSRIFLAHKDNLKSRKLGRLFGYYILKNIEIIKPANRPMPLPVQNIKEVIIRGKKTIKGDCWDGTSIVDPNLIDIRCRDLEPEAECKEGEIKEKECPDGTMITTHKCVDGKWVKTGKKCQDDGPDGECEDGDTIIEFCDYGFVVTHYCENGEWKESNADCPDPIPDDQTMFETERSCSLRLVPWSIYFVDALANDISLSFKEELAKANLVEEFFESISNYDREEIILRGRKLFAKNIKALKLKRDTYTKLPSMLEGKAEIRGELVLFNQKPIFEKYPTAAFQGIFRIDGDEIIRQISEGQSRINVFYTDDSLPSKLAQELKINKSFANRIIKTLLKIAANELKSKDIFVIPNFGKFYTIQTKARKGINPRTGEEMYIPSKKRLRFKPFKKLSDLWDEHDLK